jgi:hypothetical protein
MQTPALLDSSADSSLDGRFADNICLSEEGRAPALTYLCSELFTPLAIQIGNNHPGTTLRKQAHAGCAETRGATCYQNSPVLQFHRCFLSSSPDGSFHGGSHVPYYTTVKTLPFGRENAWNDRTLSSAGRQ